VPFIAAAATGTSQSATIHLKGGHLCGILRWSVKTLTDKPQADAVSQAVAPTTVHDLVNLAHPLHVPNDLPRQTAFGGVEFKTLRISVHLDGWKISADDGDIHLVVRDPLTNESMIVEFPDPSCTQAASSAHRDEMTAARLAIESACHDSHLSTGFHHLMGDATITGVGFFDKKHNQTGIALNGIELHPVLSFESTDCKPAAKSGNGP